MKLSVYRNSTSKNKYFWVEVTKIIRKEMSGECKCHVNDTITFLHVIVIGMCRIIIIRHKRAIYKIQSSILVSGVHSRL